MYELGSIEESISVVIMLSKIIRLTISAFALTAPVSAVAGEIGVSNSWSSGFREGTGSTVTDFTSTTQINETATYGAFKIEGGASAIDNIAPATGNGNGKGNGNGLAVAAPQAPSFEYLAGSWGEGSRTMTQDSTAQGTSTETYSFGSNNFSHSVSVFAR